MAIFSHDEYDTFREYFYRKTAILFERAKFDFVERRIAERMTITKYPKFRSYFAFLRLDLRGGELQELTNLLTVNETYFYREEYQFQCLVNSALNEIRQYKRPGQHIRIWSIPSSTGEEPYSIVLYLLEHWPPIEEVDVEIYSSDIDTNVLEVARRGIYGKRALQNVPKSVVKHYFNALPGGEEWQINADLREAVEFTQVNLNALDRHRSMRGFDIIFCRNVLIYFDDISRRKVAEGLYDALNPGGFVFLGHSESMSRISSLFKIRKFADAIIYQKPV